MASKLDILRKVWSDVPLLVELSLVGVLVFLSAGAVLVTLDPAAWPVTVFLAKTVLRICGVVGCATGLRVRFWLERKED